MADTPHPIPPAAEVLIAWKGAYIPIRQIHDPEACPSCGFYFTNRGEIAAVTVSKTNEIEEVAVTAGDIKGYTYDAKRIDVLPFRLSTSSITFNAGDDHSVRALMKKGYKVKGLYLEGKLFKGLLMSKEDIGVDRLPQKLEIRTYLKAEIVKDSNGVLTTSVRLTAKGFDIHAETRIYLNGKIIRVNNIKTSYNQHGDAIFVFSYLLTPGRYTILAEQNGVHGLIKEATTILMPAGDIDEGNK